MTKLALWVLLSTLSVSAFAQTSQNPGAPNPPPPQTCVLAKGSLDPILKATTSLQGKSDEISKNVSHSNQQLDDALKLLSDTQALNASQFDQVRQNLQALQQQVQGAQSSLNDLSTASANIQTRVNDVAAAVQNVQSGVTGLYTETQYIKNQNQATASSISALRNQVGENEALRTLNFIEEQLRADKYTLSLFVPAQNGGHLDLVRDIVFRGYTSSARHVKGDWGAWHMQDAADHLKKADAFYRRDVWGKALEHYGKSYRDLIKANKHDRGR